MKIHFLACIVTLPCILSCAGRNSEPSTSIDTVFVNFYADKMTLQQEANINNVDSAGVMHRMDSLYNFYNLSSQDVETKTTEYRKDVTTWKQFHDQVVRRLERLQQEQASTKIQDDRSIRQ
ncbi:MAG: hypothetical protein HYR76_06080 [Ignavibacteria bacterium]|nr:hypothetical protein [Ignavibacteria bacterium]MBI3766756.1 hypothetical protein [Ignavibacteriales bacterium]